MAKKCCHSFFFKMMQLSMSMKPILKKVFIDYTTNMVAQFSNNAIVKRNYIFWLILNDQRVYLWKNRYCHNILQSENILCKCFKYLQILMKYLVICWIWVDYTISITLEKFDSCDFTKLYLDKFFIQTYISVLKKKTENLFSFER